MRVVRGARGVRGKGGVRRQRKYGAISELARI